MAEIVQLRMQKLLPELGAMKKTGLLSSDEIKKLIKKKKALEYLLRRRTKTVEEYLKYIDYDIHLLSLISKRRQRLRCQLKRKEIDHSIATRINKLFKAAISRFPSNEKLWLSQIEFCKRMKWHHTISGLFTRMLQVHNSKPELWVLAAKWEFEENHAPENARNIFLRSVRFHQDSRLLWTEYFRMELMYIDWILKRKEVLDSQGVEGSENDAVLQGKLVSAVYRTATQEISDADFAISLIEVCREFHFACDLIDHIYEDIQSRHPMAEITLDALARRPIFTLHEESKNAKSLEQGKVISEVEEKVCAFYEDAVEKVKSEKMWSYYIEFAIGRWESTVNEKRKQKLLDKALKLMDRANDAALLSADLFVQWCKLLEEKGDEDSCCSVALEAARKWPKMVSLWTSCLTAHIQARMENIPTILNEALENLSDQESLPVWNLGMQWLSLSSPSELKEYFEKGMQNRKISAQVKEMYLETTALRDGIEAARELYKKLRFLYCRSPEFYRKMIHIEKAQLNPSIKRLRTYYEDALREYGSSDVDFWIEYILLELEHPDGDVSKPHVYHWRALKTLDEENTESFERKYTLLTLGHKEELFR